MRDLWSANDQMQKIVQAFSEKASDPKIKELFKRNCSSPLREPDRVMRVDVTALAGIQGWDDAAP